MRSTYTTLNTPPAGRRKAWHDAVEATYFPLDLRFRDAGGFSGTLDHWTLGDVSISHNESDGILYRRHERHLLSERDESFLITVPKAAEIRFVQDGREVLCRPGQFLVERSHLPYEFSHTDPTALWVLKVPSAMLQARIARPERLATMQFDATRSVGAVFVDMLRLTAPRLDEMDDTARNLMGAQLVDLLALAVEEDDRVLVGHASSVRNAHLLRAEHFIREHLRDGNLTPRSVSDACGISLRYLQQIFESEGTSVAAHIRTQRLLMCDEALRDPHAHSTVSEVAYDWGFSDLSQFSRSYRTQFGCSPREARAAARASGAANQAFRRQTPFSTV